MIMTFRLGLILAAYNALSTQTNDVFLATLYNLRINMFTEFRVRKRIPLTPVSSYFILPCFKKKVHFGKREEANEPPRDFNT